MTLGLLPGIASARLLACACLLAAACGPAWGAERSRPADAVAFIRVVGDMRAEFIHVWRRPIVRKNVEVAIASGFVIAPSGLVLTNHHVVDEAPVVQRIDGQEAEVTVEGQRIEVLLGSRESQRALEGWVVASDPDPDLAVLQVTVSDLSYVPFGDSDALEQGRAVRALGFPSAGGSTWGSGPGQKGRRR